MKYVIERQFDMRGFEKGRLLWDAFEIGLGEANRG